VVSLEMTRQEPDGKVCRTISLGAVRGRLGLVYVDRTAPDRVDMRDRLDYLLAKLEREAAATLPCRGRARIMIHKFRLENQRTYSRFADYLDRCIIDTFASSRWFIPVENPEVHLTRSLGRGTRNIVPGPSAAAAMASAVDADYYLTGSFWPRPGGTMEIKAKISHSSGRVPASESVVLRTPGVDPAWFNPAPQAVAPSPAGELGVEVFTQRGADNLVFRKGEEITFFIRATRQVYVRLFSSNVHNQVYQIYPNDYGGHNRRFAAGEVLAVPHDGCPPGFTFKVAPPTGRETVVAIASDRPLPDLPGSVPVPGAYGMKQMGLSLGEITAWYGAYALKRGISLSRDVLPVLTRP